MKIDTSDTGKKNNKQGLNVPPFLLTARDFLLAVGGSIAFSTYRCMRDFPRRVYNRYLRWYRQKKRMPKRTTQNRVYVLVGYTTKAYVDRKFRAMKVQMTFRRVLLLTIALILIILVYRMIDPMQYSDDFFQMMGIEDMDELTRQDPFVMSEETNGLFFDNNEMESFLVEEYY